MSIRAVRNNNPGNLNAKDPWQGLQPRKSMTPAQAAEKRFAVFSTPVWGFRALAINLLNYQRLHELTTVRGIISRFAPANENETAAYIAAVCKALGVDPDADIDLKNPGILSRLCRAIAIVESGGNWLFSDDDLAAGVQMAEGT